MVARKKSNSKKTKQLKNKKITEKQILEALKKVIDPEIGFNIVDMGFIYNVKIDKKINITMTLSSPMCPMADYLLNQVKDSLKEFNMETDIKLVFNPPWSPMKMDKKLRKKIGF